MKKQLVLIILILQSVFTLAQVPTQERDALMALYNATNGPNWTFPGQWGSTTTPVADWFGVNVENILGQDHVTVISLCCNGLSGYIPTEIEGLSYLKTLDLSGNQLPGDIPIVLFSLTNLEDLSLEGCQLSGIIPSEIGDLLNLTNLSLISNQLTGNLPPEIGDLLNLSILNVRNNQLSGSIPTEIENLLSIEGIALSYNEFSGELDLSNLINLYGLLIENNNFLSLNVQNGNNTNFAMFNITNNPNLICVFVDDTSWSETNWLDKDETAQYFETQAECDTYLSIDENITVSSIRLFPNPTSRFVNIDMHKGVLIKNVQVYSVLGEQMNTSYTSDKIDLTKLNKGVYFIKLQDETNKNFTYKIIKK